MSPYPIDRILRPWRRRGHHHRFSLTKPGTLLKGAIPIKTSADLEDQQSGFLEIDLVHHCGESTGGFYLTTLSTVDVATGWSECLAVWGKGQDRVGGAIHRMRRYARCATSRVVAVWGGLVRRRTGAIEMLSS